MGRRVNESKQLIESRIDYLQSEIAICKKNQGGNPNSRIEQHARGMQKMCERELSALQKQVAEMPDYLPAPTRSSRSARKPKGASLPQQLGILMCIYVALAVFSGESNCTKLTGSQDICQAVQSFLPY